MSNEILIKKHLPEMLREIAMNFSIPDLFLEKETQLVIMVLESRSIDTTEEKQNWFNLLPLMNEEQMKKLRSILDKEKKKLKEIEEKYEKKKQEIKQKYLQKREETGTTEKIQEIKQKEKNIVAQDLEEADDLLDMI